MEEQLVAQHRLVDRVIAQRAEPDGSLRYLAKVRCSLWGPHSTPGAGPGLRIRNVLSMRQGLNKLLHDKW